MLALLMVNGFWQGSGLALAGEGDNQEVNFDSSMLWGQGARSVDLDRYAEGNPVEAGTHSLAVFVNDDYSIGTFDIRFDAGDKPGRAKPCFTPELLDRLGIDLEKLPLAEGQQKPDAGQCLDLPARISGASYSVDTGEQSLHLSVPQLYMRRNPRGYVSPERWDRGVTAGFLDYSANGYESEFNGKSNQNAYGSLNMGFNIGDWRLRQRSSLNWDNESGSRHEVLSSFAQRDIDALRSQLTIGDAFTDGDLFDSVSMRGLRLASDDRMLPDSQTGYAPVVRGIASTNARVTVRQRGYIIYETTVSPGAFEINDLNPTSDNGDLDVTVTEANGQESHFIVPFSSVARSLRPGVSRYTASIGKARDLQYDYSPTIAQGTYQRGLTNAITGYTGVTASEDYSAATLGSVLNTQYGAFGADITNASTDLGKQNYTGQSVRVSYNKVMPDTGTDFTLAAYRYSTDGYFGLSDALTAIDQVQELGGDSSERIRRLRTRSEVNINQRITDRDYFYVNGSRQDYWNDSGYDTQLQAGYTRSWSWGSTSLSMARTQDPFGKSETQTLFSVSIPLGRESGYGYLSSSVSHSTSGASNVQTSYSGSAGEQQQLSYGLTANHDRPSDGDSASTLSGNAQYRGSRGMVSGSLSKSADYRQASVGVSGSVVAHPAGVTFGQSLGDSIAIIDAPGAAGALVSSASNVSLDGRGQAVVPYLSAYRRNELALDPKGLSDDVELKTTSQEVVPRSGAVMLVKYDTITGRALLVQSRRSDGSSLPFGASVYDQEGREVGAVGQGGKIFARVDADEGQLRIGLGGKDNSQCSISFKLPPREQGKSSSVLDKIDAPCL
ncbi:fimbrial biogenesis outer membrane usher protein [Pseudomonas sp. PDNC002]|uniref:fimbria/pilus outer membrane usher protein n=1 Tax=Pseudomonas sp. PDNC002 TaxID=2811422 RepID=UPI001965F993|nr:fimbria/pilus outer membrane usher protein [Pseudomonas sp. PDNC002]QRY77821.1 fimbrial biogenesis outer membrane usher protein [Pseudomonas sp. PDNC002]